MVLTRVFQLQHVLFSSFDARRRILILMFAQSCLGPRTVRLRDESRVDRIGGSNLHHRLLLASFGWPLVLGITTIAAAVLLGTPKGLDKSRRTPEQQADGSGNRQDATRFHQVAPQIETAQDDAFAQLVRGFRQGDDQDVLDLNLVTTTTTSSSGQASFSHDLRQLGCGHCFLDKCSRWCAIILM